MIGLLRHLSDRLAVGHDLRDSERDLPPYVRRIRMPVAQTRGNAPIGHLEGLVAMLGDQLTCNRIDLGRVWHAPKV